MVFQRFYSLPPREIDYPFLLVNIKKTRELKKRTEVKHSIVDCGIYDLLHPPYRHSEEKIVKWEKLRLVNGWKVVPDIPSLKYEFDIDPGYTNTDYSKELLLQLFNPSDPSHLPVMQSEIIKGSDSYKESTKNFVKWFIKEFGNEHPQIGIGGVCKAGSRRMIIWTMSFIRRSFPGSWLHVFGLRLQHFNYIYYLMDSYDSMSYTFPRVSFEKAGRGTSMTKEQRMNDFNVYINLLHEKERLVKQRQPLVNYFN
jgi:hypothetical protein